MKINLKNNDYFKENKKLDLKTLAKGGVIVAIAATIGGIYTGISLKNKNNSDEIGFEDIVLETSMDDVNNLNIIINDNNCSDSFFQEVCSNLKDDGLEITVTKDDENINVDNSVIITLDQQYSSGSSTLIFAPYDNTRIGNSDSLTLAMQSAFLQNGFFAEEIIPGKLGFREDENGNVTNLVPTETEEALSETCDSSFVTISFGTHNVNAEWVAKSIENGLARQSYYINNYDVGTDLLYRADSGEEISVLADYFKSNVHDLSSYNNLTGSETNSNMVIVNPGVSNMTVFNKNTQLKIDDVKTKAY